MKRVILSLVALVGLMSSTVLAQPANYAWRAEFDGSFGNIRTFSDGATGSAIRSLSIEATSADDQYIIEWNSFADKWQNGTTPFNSVFTLFHGDSNSPDGIFSPAATSGKFYTVQIDGLAYSDRSAIVMETSNTPIAFDGTTPVSSVPSVVAPNQSFDLTITLAGNKSAEEKAFLRYSTDGFSTSDVIEVTFGSSTASSGTVTIPGSVNTANASISFYVYTTTVAANSSSNHDLITLNLANNGGSNYSYTVASNWATTSASSWSTPSTWAAGEVPPSGQDIVIAHDVTLDQDATVSTLTINGGATFTASDASARTLTISKSATGTSTTLTNSGTWANGTGGSTVVFSGEPNSGDAIHSITGTIAFDNLEVSKTGGTNNVGADFQTGTSLTGTLKIGNGGYISTAPPSNFYSSSAILAFDQGGAADYVVGATDNSWSTTEIPQSITISSATVTLSAARTVNTAVVVESGATLVSNGNLTLSDNSRLLNSGTVTGDINFARTISGSAGWRMLSAPITGFQIDDISDNTAIQGITGSDYPTAPKNFFHYDNTGAWETPTNLTTTFGDGYGFITYFYNNTDFGSSTLPITLDATGSEPGSDVTVNLFADSVGSFTLLGNPFASNFDLSSIDNSGSDFNNNVQIWNAAGSNYQTMQLNTGGVVSAWQGFWLELEDNTQTSITLPTSGKTSSDATASYFSKEVNQPSLQFELISSDRTDKSTKVIFGENFTLGWDIYDASQLLPLLDSYATIGFVGLRNGATAVKVIESLPTNLDEPIYIPMQLTSAGFNGDLSLAWKGIETLPSEWGLKLIDKNGNEFDLRESNKIDFSHKSIAAKAQHFSVGSPAIKATSGDSDYTLVITPNRLTSNEDVKILPSEVQLHQNFPNPFNPTTQISFSLPANSQVTLSVYDMNGRLVENLVNGTRPAGLNVVTWNASIQASGLYVVRLTTGAMTLTRKMSLIK